ncbi:hypothetical protein [Streptomyces sp. NBC_01264]|uniref:hypothetical protein n=1 Tax=Streptomyces sp. NBC_01264 TaxID=2903804 RepID=UPI002254C424|nr:hypothetical protein [Streptomyces sp. NBC_01264]MCX4783335.1 hypothetical protein [Streptomyces sp. NBC_01264]
MTDRSHLPEPGWGMICALLAIGLAGPAVSLSGDVLDLAEPVAAPPPATAPDVPPS